MTSSAGCLPDLHSLPIFLHSCLVVALKKVIRHSRRLKSLMYGGLKNTMPECKAYSYHQLLIDQERVCQLIIICDAGDAQECSNRTLCLNTALDHPTTFSLLHSLPHFYIESSCDGWSHPLLFPTPLTSTFLFSRRVDICLPHWACLQCLKDGIRECCTACSCVPKMS